MYAQGIEDFVELYQSDTSNLYSVKRSYLTAAINLAKKKTDEAKVYTLMADLEESFHHRQDAENYYLKAIFLFDSLEVWIDLATTELNYGLLLNEMEDYELSLQYLNRSIKHYNLSDNKALTALCYMARATVYYYTGKNDSARADIQTSLRLAPEHEKPELKHKADEILLLIKQAENEIKDGDIKKLKQNLQYFSENENYEEVGFVAKNIGFIYAETGQYDSSLVYYSLALQMAQSSNDLVLTNDLTAKIKVLNELLARENRIKQLWLIGSIVVSGILIVLFSFLSIFIRNKRRLEKQELEIKDSRIRDLLKEQEIKSTQALLAGQDKERKRIAEELHDRLGSMLATVKLHFSHMQSHTTELDSKAEKIYENAGNLIDEAAAEVRRISHDLHSGLLQKFGLFAALQQMGDSIHNASGIKVNVLRTHWDERLDFDAETNLYRIVQELISNALKHAKATEITIQLSKDIETGTLIYEDNGKGFDLKKVNLGLGLKNIESRVDRINGKLNIDSTPGYGTTVIVEFDL